MPDPTHTDPDLEGLLGEARALLPEAVALRRRIHAEPEIGLDLPRTREAVLEALAGLPLEVRTSPSTSAVVATLRGGRPGKVVLLRADMDALPLQEDTGLGFASRQPGRMHACGHDAHVAMLAAAARLLARRQRDLAGAVHFFFQPGEEGYFGARKAIEEGLFVCDPPIASAFALHVHSLLPSGSVAVRPGPILAAADTLHVTLTGRGGHASMPHDALDPIPAACELVLALQSFVTRRMNAHQPVVLSVTRIQAGTTDNIIPETVELEGTLRSLTTGSRDALHAGLAQVARGIAAAHGLEVTVKVDPGYPPTVNDATFTGFAREVAARLVGGERIIDLEAPLMGAEDFSYILERVPGAMFFLGVHPSGSASVPLHSNRMVLDEEALSTGIALHAAVALSQGAGA